MVPMVPNGSHGSLVPMVPNGLHGAYGSYGS